jgi:adenylate cyclase
MPTPSTPTPEDPPGRDQPLPATAANRNWLETEDGRQLPFRGNCRIGRGTDNHIIIDTPKASRQHAVIHVQDEIEFWLIDLGSVNGTYRNERRLLQPTRLNHGDRIAVAGAHFTFHQPGLGAQPTTTLHGRAKTTGGSATVAEFKEHEAWLLIADIEGFTQLSHECPPEELAMRVGRWCKECRRLVARRGGRISKYLGDGFLACWETSESSAGQVAQILSELRELRDSGAIRFRVAVHYGPVTFGGSTEFGEESMTSPELNFIFRLEDLASRLGVPFCASESAQIRLADHLSLEPVDGEHELKGFPGEHRCFVLRQE